MGVSKSQTIWLNVWSFPAILHISRGLKYSHYCAYAKPLWINFTCQLQNGWKSPDIDRQPRNIFCFQYTDAYEYHRYRSPNNDSNYQNIYGYQKSNAHISYISTSLKMETERKIHEIGRIFQDFSIIWKGVIWLRKYYTKYKWLGNLVVCSQRLCLVMKYAPKRCPSYDIERLPAQPTCVWCFIWSKLPHQGPLFLARMNCNLSIDK